MSGNGAWLALGVAGAVAAAGAVAGRGGSGNQEQNTLKEQKALVSKYLPRAAGSGADWSVSAWSVDNDDPRRGYKGERFIILDDDDSWELVRRFSQDDDDDDDNDDIETLESFRSFSDLKRWLEKNARRGGSMARSGIVPLRQRVYRLENEEGTFTGNLESMYPGFFDGVQKADPNVLHLRKGASTHVGGGAAPRAKVTRLK
jgi:hypothetical protein